MLCLTAVSNAPAALNNVGFWEKNGKQLLSLSLD